MKKECFENLAKSYIMQVYVEVSKNHNIPLAEVIKRKFDPEIRLLIMYYNHQFRLQQREYDDMKDKQEEVNNGNW